MYILFYTVCFGIAVILSLILVGEWRKRFDVNLALIFFTVTLADLGYVLLYMSRNLREALVAQKVIYIGGCFLPLFVLLLVIRLCRIKVGKWVKIIMGAVSGSMFVLVLTAGIYPVFYKAVEFERRNGIVYLNKTYTAFHTLFSVLLMMYFLAGILILMYTAINRTDVSHKIVLLLVLPLMLCIVGFWVTKIINGAELQPVMYDASLVVYLYITRKICLYDIADTCIDAMVEEGDTGFISLDNKLNYLGSNETARHIIPDIARVNIDTCIKDYRLFEDNLIRWINVFEEGERAGSKKDQFICSDASGERHYYVNVSAFYDGSRKRGYQFFFVDNTKEYNYNERLKKDVREKTAHIVEMHNTLIMGMATMVESRDNSTGGHIKRTSRLVEILVGKIMKDRESVFDLSEEFCADLIKAAPMHDLGKIAVDDDILRKPGKFEDWEFEIMKKHAPEGARIVHEILKDTDDEMFHEIAENVAHYHHERWDGSGYPRGLKGEEIPLEARIMAIADVYDALVSKRVYKERMSFEKADSIIMEGMGRHFDKNLEPYYVASRKEFEEYYTALESEENNDSEGKEEYVGHTV
ncbi:N-terminal 7TM region of histidine kinase [Lachnospiraceae bacterium XBB2008]|nr:N-terminal 7TM region of histidine kinase [Lachnospiraceae bacterium XBB2008]